MLQIESTQTIAHIEGVKCRLWKGLTQKGDPVAVYVHIIMAPEALQAEFQAELEEQAAPAEYPAGAIEMFAQPCQRDAGEN